MEQRLRGLNKRPLDGRSPNLTDARLEDVATMELGLTKVPLAPDIPGSKAKRRPQLSRGRRLLSSVLPRHQCLCDARATTSSIASIHYVSMDEAASAIKADTSLGREAREAWLASSEMILRAFMRPDIRF